MTPHFPARRSRQARSLLACVLALGTGWTGLMAAGPNAPAWLPADFPAVEETGEVLCRRFFLTPEQGQSVLDAATRTFAGRREWESSFARARERIRSAAGLKPWPERTPLNPILHSERAYDGYRVLNVAFESLPGYWATGNLYLPAGREGPLPAVLHTHGHSGDVDDEGGWARHGRFKEDVQYRAASLARMGSVCLTLDMYGYGDSTEQLGPDAHRDPLAMTLQIWNAMRALDFLETLDGVDPARLAVTGHSGGGTQAFLLAALDSRVAVSVPVAMVSARFFGGCPCESGLPIHLSRDHFVNNAMIAAMAAPRPQLLVSDGGDWTDQVPAVEYPFLQEVYRDFGAPENVENVHLADEGHNYGFSKRAALYPFLARHLGLDLSAVLDASGAVDESAVTIEDPRLMRVFTAQYPVPEGAMRQPGEIRATLERLRESGRDRLRLTDLRCDGMTDPVGVDTLAPVLSWRLASDGHDKWQGAYQIEAAGTRAALLAGHDLLWESGPVDSDEQLQVAYGGQPLASGQTVWWRVRVRDEADNLSPWSEPASFTAGLLSPADWTGKWITHPQWLAYERPHLGYRSLPAARVESPKWLEVDLGAVHPIDQVVLRALRHTVAERMGFPTHFRLLASVDPAFGKPVVLADTLEKPANRWLAMHRIDGGGVHARFIRLEAPVLRELNGEICLALSQMEIHSGGRNIAPAGTVRASDSLEDGPWAVAAVIDGKGVPGYNPLANQTLVAKRSFTIDGDVPERALVHLSGLGHYVLHLNARRVGQQKISPGWSDLEKTVYVDSFDVGPLLHKGENTLEISLAGGMYSVPDPEGRYTKFIGRVRPLTAILQLEMTFSDGSRRTLVSDTDWRIRPGPVTYAHVYGGEDLDLRKLEPDPADPVSRWVSAVETDGPGGCLVGRSRAAPPLEIADTRQAVLLHKLAPGVEIYDLGQNASHLIRMRASGPAGSRLRVTPAELLAADGRLDRGSCGGGQAFWQLTLDGRPGPVDWEAEFFYHGARYLQVERFPSGGPGPDAGPLPELAELTGLVVHTRAEPAGDFACSSDLFNRVRTLIRWAQRSNLASVLTDCPHRERLGWLEQYHLNGPSLRYEYALTQLFTKTFQDMADAQTPDGLVPDIAPEYIVFEGPFRDSPEWGSALILAAWQQFLFSGDQSVFRDHYPDMVGYMDYLGSLSTGDLLHHGLGDWYDLGPERPGFSQLTPPAVTASAIYHQNARTLARIATLLGKPEDARRWEALAGRIRTAFNQAFLDESSGRPTYGSQTANAMPLSLGMVPEGKESAIQEALVADIRERGNSLTSGDVGHAYLLRALSQGGRQDVVFDLHHQSERPGYGYQIRVGATSLTEAWDAGRRSSQNHFMLGHLTEWLYAELVGLAPDESRPGFKHVRIQPKPVGDISWAEATHRSPYGPVHVRWERQPGLLTLYVELPPNTSATVHSPPGYAGALHEIGSGTHTIPFNACSP